MAAVAIEKEGQEAFARMTPWYVANIIFHPRDKEGALVLKEEPEVGLLPPKDIVEHMERLFGLIKTTRGLSHEAKIRGVNKVCDKWGATEEQRQYWIGKVGPDRGSRQRQDRQPAKPKPRRKRPGN